MAYFHLALQRSFSKGAVEGRVKEQRIVSETVISARRFEQAAFHLAAKRAH